MLTYKDMHSTLLELDTDNIRVTVADLDSDQWYIEKGDSDEIDGCTSLPVWDDAEAYELEDEGFQLWACDEDLSCSESEEDEVMWHPVWIAD